MHEQGRQFMGLASGYLDVPFIPHGVRPTLLVKTSKPGAIVSSCSTLGTMVSLKLWICLIGLPDATPSKRARLLPNGCAIIPVHMLPYAIGVDLGGTNLRAAAVDHSGTMPSIWEVPTFARRQ